METRKIPINDVNQLAFLGLHDANIKILERHFSAKFIVRNGEVVITGEPAENNVIEKVLSELIYLVNRNNTLTESEVLTTIEIVKGGEASEEFTRKTHGKSDIILHTKRGFIKPKSRGQNAYLASARKNDIVFSIGPAGTGKTYMAVAIALAFLRDKEVDKLVLARPAVEAGESLGF